MPRARRAIPSEIEEILAADPSDRSSKAQVAYLVPNPRRGIPGQEPMLRLWYAGDGVFHTMDLAMGDLRAARRRGYTAWIVDATGRHVPVTGARRPYPGTYST